MGRTLRRDGRGFSPTCLPLNTGTVGNRCKSEATNGHLRAKFGPQTCLAFQRWAPLGFKVVETVAEILIIIIGSFHAHAK